MLVEYGVSRKREAASLSESSAVIAGLSYDKAQDHEARDYSSQFSIRLHLRQLLSLNHTTRQDGAARLAPNLKLLTTPLQGKTVPGERLKAGNRLTSLMRPMMTIVRRTPTYILLTPGLLLNAYGKMIVPESQQEVM
jgi:hypothetical protein